MDLSPDKLRKRFHELRATVADIETKSAPIRQEYDRVSQTMEMQCKKLAAQFKAIEAPLFDLKNEMGLIARALQGKTGKPG